MKWYTKRQCTCGHAHRVYLRINLSGPEIEHLCTNGSCYCRVYSPADINVKSGK